MSKQRKVKTNKGRVIVTLAVGSETSWYFAGQKKLIESLNANGETEIFLAAYEKITFGSAYDDKVAHIKHAGQYFTKLLWLDCSITAIKSLKEIWEYIEKEGVFLYQSGGNCAETCNDHCLKMYNITRDEAERVNECASNVVGIDLSHPKGRKFFDLWVSSLTNGSNVGCKWPSLTERLGESLDPRFKYHRQDQSTASLAAYRADVKLEPEGKFVVRKENLEYHKNDSIVFVLSGGVGE